ncbi:tetratricopeptide repeat protein [Palleronia aestuarii]|uniref:Tetratricopeptide repeat protein n=1 Tax=Palleronia aestuarii TaxID=568105 RepID=A0A2W7NBY7_9RHOB|nr:tetratricopeptide repeat protein [Palleronia aestuarii]PZX17133.1 tetratricopeptide repeat protein [Palleronia aestuarii]
MTRRCILQIGTEKTGTTSLQMFLSRNRDRLGARGIRYPRFPGQFNHTGLPAYAMDDDRRDPIRDAFGVHSAEAVAGFRRRIERQAEAELDGQGITIFCSEHCHSRLKTREEVQRLADLLMPHFDRIDVSIYLRRQDEVAVSLHSTRLKGGETDKNILPETDAGNPYFNYDRSLSLWEDVFGRPHVRVRLFERSELVDGDVVSDFLSAWGLGPLDAYRAVKKLNESVDARAQDFLRRVNATLEPLSGLPREAVQGPLADSLARLFPGKGPRPSRAAAEAFYATWRSSNEAVRKRHFPNRETLFREDFGGYPEEADRIEYEAEDIARVAARLQHVQAREIRRLEAEIRIREGRLAWERGEREVALGFFRRAAAHLPDYAEAARTLAEYLHRSELHGDAAVQARRAAELRPDHHEYWHFLGIALHAAGDVQEAIVAQERALAIAPDHEPSQRTLDALRVRLAEIQAAG